MRVLLFLLAVLAAAAGGLILVAAQSAIHQIEGFMLFLISAVLLVGSAIVDAVLTARTRLETVGQLIAQNIKPAGQPGDLKREDFS